VPAERQVRDVDASHGGPERRQPRPTSISLLHEMILAPTMRRSVAN
jgi:hypothetical protein